MARRQTIDYLITFDHDTRKQIGFEEFRDTAKALKAYSEREEQYRDNPSVEVVLLGAHSVEAIKVTHSNYFEDTAYALETLLANLGQESIAAQASS